MRQLLIEPQTTAFRSLAVFKITLLAVQLLNNSENIAKPYLTGKNLKIEHEEIRSNHDNASLKTVDISIKLQVYISHS